MKTLILDDEPMPAKQLAALIKRKFPEIKSCEIVQSIEKAKSYLETEVVDILFLDIQMNEMNGFEFLKETELPSQTKVIFTTAYQEYALEAFEADAFHYLVKPVTEESLSKALRKVKRQESENKKVNVKKGFFAVFNNHEHHILKTKDILRLEAYGSYTKVITKEETIVSSKNIGWNETKLDSEMFVRVHKSHLVNINHISRFSKNDYVALNNGDIVPLAASRQKELDKAMGL
ncbi:MAG: LytTR family DNA-binding domain-containing protein [Vicingaceae bacterium]